MWLVKLIEQAALGPIYRLAIWLRSAVWRLRRTTLIGVRALIVRDGAILLIRHRSGKQPWALPGGGVERTNAWPRPPDARRTRRPVRQSVSSGCWACTIDLVIGSATMS